MATKTLTVRLDEQARERTRIRPASLLKRLVGRSGRRADSITGRQLLERLRTSGPMLSEESLERIEAAKRDARPPEDKWQEV